jgi:hypothetical protein
LLKAHLEEGCRHRKPVGFWRRNGADGSKAQMCVLTLEMKKLVSIQTKIAFCFLGRTLTILKFGELLRNHLI